MFSHITLAAFSIVLVLTIVAVAASPKWSLAAEMAYAIAGEH